MNQLSALATLALWIVSVALVHAQVPQVLSYQGRIAVGNSQYNGTGSFKFSIVSGAGTTTYWANDAQATGGGEPGTAVSLTVTNGVYSVLLGDSTIPNMAPIPPAVFGNNRVFLRVWFNDGSHGFQKLAPDQQIAAIGYAVLAGSALTVANGSIGSSQLALGAVAPVNQSPDVAVLFDEASGKTPELLPKAGWNARNLTGINKVPATAGSISLTGNTVTIQPGTYLVEAEATTINASNNQLILRDVSNGASGDPTAADAAILGLAAYGDTGHDTSTSALRGVLTIVGAARQYQLWHYVYSAQTDGQATQFEGFGVGVASGLNSRYAHMTIVRLQ